MTTMLLANVPATRRGSGAPTAIFRDVTPNLFTTVMGTGIVATAAATLPVQFVGLRVFATIVWASAAFVMIALTVALAVHWTVHRVHALAHSANPVTVQFYGAPPMALLTVGAGAELLGGDILGNATAMAVFATLWTAGTVLGVLASVTVPYLMITTHDHTDVAALPAWLIPVVPPMVSASTGALLLPHVAPGQGRSAMLVGCYALFGLSLVVGMLTVALVYGRLLHRGAPAAQAAPTIWITLGIVGQSVTAAVLLGNDAALVFTGDDATIATGLRVFGIVHGLVMGGFGVFVFALAAAVTMRSLRREPSFSMSWWSFTFPIGTCVTGATALGGALGSAAVDAVAVVLYVVLVSAWAVVVARTVCSLTSTHAPRVGARRSSAGRCRHVERSTPSRATGRGRGNAPAP